MFDDALSNLEPLMPHRNIKWDYCCWLGNTFYNRMLNKLNVLYTNFDILANKLNDLHLLAVEHHFDIIMIKEVKPKHICELITHQNINLEGFDIY